MIGIPAPAPVAPKAGYKTVSFTARVGKKIKNAARVLGMR
jgi:hypothetical protein